MLKKNIKIVNVYGKPEIKTLHFNLTRMEVFDLQKKYKEGYEDYVKNTIDSKNENSMLDVFTELVLSAYCEIDENGNVIKNENLKNTFYHSEEFSELMFQLLNSENTNEAEKFFKAIMPSQLQSAINQQTVNVSKIEEKKIEPTNN